MITLPLTGRSRYAFALLTAAAGVVSLVLFRDFFQRSPLTPAWIVSLLSLLVAGVVPAILAEVVIITATLYFAIEPFNGLGFEVPGDGIRISIWIACIGLADFLAWRLQVARGDAVAREKALTESESRYRNVLEQASDGIVLLDSAGRFILVNQRVADMLGYREEELLRLSLLDVYATGEWERPRAAWEEMKDGVVLEERRLRRKDGSVFEAELSLRQLGEGRLQGILRDITERRRAEEARLGAQRTLQRVTASVPGVVYQYVITRGRPGRFEYVSERVRELFGVTAAQVIADPECLRRVVEPEDREAAAVMFRKAAARLEPYSVDFRIRPEPGTVRWLRAIATPVREGDSMVWHGVMVDITDQRRLQQELLQAQKMESLGRLAGGVAHDFNNLLTVIRGYADVLADQLGSGDPRLDEVREIRHAADRGASLTRQLLALSRRQVLTVREVDLNGLVTDLERMLRRVIGDHIEIVTVTAPQLGWVRADPGQLEQVLLNLAVNARDAMPEGGVLRIETRRMLVSGAGGDRVTRGVPPGDYVMVEVSDTGTGMDAEAQAKAFEPFFTTKPAGEGTGLGLATVYGIVQQTGGAVNLESALGKGTSIRVFLPRTALPAEPAPEPVPEPAPPRRRSRGTVLVVEDEERVRRLTSRILEHYGYRVVEAEDGRAALERLRDGRTGIDAMVSDVLMPGIKGTDLAVSARQYRPGLPVLLLSGFPAEEMPEFQAGNGDSPQAFLQKPFSPEALAIAMEELLGRS